jgi:hypothetical protein
MTLPRLANERVPLYRRVLGEVWDSLPEPLRARRGVSIFTWRSPIPSPG